MPVYSYLKFSCCNLSTVTYSMNITSFLVQTCRKVNSSRVIRRLLHENFVAQDTSVFTEANVKNQLTELSIPFEEGYTCLHLKECACFKNNPSAAKKDGFVFVNRRTGCFLCEHCKGTGDWESYNNLLMSTKEGLVDLSFLKQNWPRYDRNAAEWLDVVNTTESVRNLSNDNYERIWKEFNLPFCPRFVTEKLKIRISEDRSVLFFPLLCSTSSVVGYKTLDKDGNECTFPRTDCPGFLLFSTYSKSLAVVVAKICDFLALASLNISNYDVICLQYGTSHLPQLTLPFLEKYHKIILWLGAGSLDSTGNVAKKLIEKRCFVIRPIGNQVSASTALSKEENIKEILLNAKLTWHQCVITFSSLREEVLAEVQDRNQAVGVPWIRFPALTKLLKGHRRGELTILTGPTGVGKTTFLSEYSLDLALQGVNTLWGSFELKNTRLAKILLTQFAETSIPKDNLSFNALCDQFEELPIYFLTFHGQQDLPMVMDAIQHCSYAYDIAHVIIDNVQFMIEVTPDMAQFDRFWKQDYMIQSFRKFASTFNCHVTLVMHPKKIEGMDLSVTSIFGGVKASQEADNILIIQKKDLNTFGVKKYLQVSKNRFSGDLGVFPLHFDKNSLCFSKPPRANQDFIENVDSHKCQLLDEEKLELEVNE